MLKKYGILGLMLAAGVAQAEPVRADVLVQALAQTQTETFAKYHPPIQTVT